MTHGMTGYRRGCRCVECQAAHRDYYRAYRERKRDGATPLTPAQRGAISARARNGDAPKVIRLDSLSEGDRRAVLAFVDALRAKSSALPGAGVLASETLRRYAQQHGASCGCRLCESVRFLAARAMQKSADAMDRLLEEEG